MRAIVGIGGGELGRGETRPIDEYIVSLSGKEHPRILFLPTASHDEPDYIRVFEEQYGALGCDTAALCLWSYEGTAEDVRQFILYADIVYIGGGCMEAMLGIWEKYHVAETLYEAWKRGIVCCGLSAGCICWTDHSYCDYDDGHGFFGVDCMGILPIIIGPHYNQPEWQGFDEYMKTQELPGIAVENNTALSVVDGEYRIIHADPERKAYLLLNRNGEIEKAEYEGGVPGSCRADG